MNCSINFFIVAYAILLGCYFYTRIGNNFVLRATNKIMLSSMFMLFALVHYINHYNVIGHQGIAMAGVIFAFLGDIFLIWSFTTGGILFMISNIIFFIYELVLLPVLNLSFADIWWFIIILAALYLPLIVLVNKKWIHLNGKTIPLLFYIFTVSLHGSLGIVLLSLSGLTKITLLGLGLALFMVSDYFIILNKFKYNNNIMQWCNSLTYFVGLLLVALSFIYQL